MSSWFRAKGKIPDIRRESVTVGDASLNGRRGGTGTVIDVLQTGIAATAAAQAVSCSACHRLVYNNE
jgi:hypothetical protein